MWASGTLDRMQLYTAVLLEQPDEQRVNRRVGVWRRDESRTVGHNGQLRQQAVAACGYLAVCPLPSIGHMPGMSGASDSWETIGSCGPSTGCPRAQVLRSVRQEQHLGWQGDKHLGGPVPLPAQALLTVERARLYLHRGRQRVPASHVAAVLPWRCTGLGCEFTFNCVQQVQPPKANQ